MFEVGVFVLFSVINKTRFNHKLFISVEQNSGFLYEIIKKNNNKKCALGFCIMSVTSQCVMYS